MKVVLHIGPHKTGTTSIQKFMHANARQLRRHGIAYPEPWDGNHNHHCIAHGLRTPERHEQTCVRIRRTLDACLSARVETCVLSSEMFVEEGIDIRSLPTLFRDCDLHVIAYIRAPHHQWASAFAQLVHEQSVRRTARIDEEPVPYDCGYSTMFLKWMAHFPPGRMVICPFDPRQWHGGRLELDFLRAVGAGEAALVACSCSAGVHANASLPATLIEVLRAANAASSASPGMRSRLISDLERLAADHQGALGPAPSLQAPELIRKAFEMLEPHLASYRPYFRPGFDESFLHGDGYSHG